MFLRKINYYSPSHKVCVWGGGGLFSCNKRLGGKRLYKTIGTERNYDTTSKKSKMCSGAEILIYDITDSSKLSYI